MTIIWNYKGIFDKVVARLKSPKNCSNLKRFFEFLVNYQRNCRSQTFSTRSYTNQQSLCKTSCISDCLRNIYSYLVETLWRIFVLMSNDVYNRLVQRKLQIIWSEKDGRTSISFGMYLVDIL